MLWKKFTDWLKARLHLKEHELKGAPGVHDPAAAADHVNVLVGGAIDAIPAETAIGVVENALHVKPDQLKGAPGFGDHELAAGAINAIVAAKLGE